MTTPKEVLALVEDLIRRDPACFNLSDELQSVRAVLRSIVASLEGDAVERMAQLAEAYERAAKVADEHRAHVPNHDPEMQSDDLVAQGYGNAAFNIAVAIRKLTQEVKHEAE